MDRKQLVSSVLAKAKKYRGFTRWISDWETAQRISALSEKLQRRASVLAKPTKNRIRRRAQKSQKRTAARPEGMRSSGSAEREFHEAETLAEKASAEEAADVSKRSEQDY